MLLYSLRIIWNSNKKHAALGKIESSNKKIIKPSPEARLMEITKSNQGEIFRQISRMQTLSWKLEQTENRSLEWREKDQKFKNSKSWVNFTGD